MQKLELVSTVQSVLVSTIVLKAELERAVKNVGSVSACLPLVCNNCSFYPVSPVLYTHEWTMPPIGGDWGR